MYTLRVLGGLDLQGEHGDNGNEVVAQPRRIALLVYLAMTTTSAPLRRDQVLGLDSLSALFYLILQDQSSFCLA